MSSLRCEATACQGSMMFAIKAEVSDPCAETLAFNAQKTMYGGKHIAKGDTIFVFASENEGGPGLIASGVITSAKAIAKKRGIARQTPRVSIIIRRTSVAGVRRDDRWLERDCRPASHIVGNIWEPESVRPRFQSCRGFAAKWPPCFQGLESIPSPPAAGF